MRNINLIIVHCSATAAGRRVGVAEIDRWHRARGFNSIGYHWIVDIDGNILPGRPEAIAGAHCKGHNASSIGVCYIGGTMPDGKTPADTRTPAQKKALKRLLTDLRHRYPGAKIRSHRDFAAKACPSFDATAEYASL